MKFSPPTLISTIKRYFAKTISGLLLLGIIWQGIALGVDTAIAAPLLATSNSDMVEQVTDKADRVKGQMQSAVQDAKKSADKSMNKSKDAIDKNAKKVEKSAAKSMNKAKDAINKKAKKVEKSAKNTTKKAKNFFGM
jgi:gas vesicle protein